MGFYRQSELNDGGISESLFAALPGWVYFISLISYDNGSVMGNFGAYLQMQPNDGEWSLDKGS